MGDIGRVILGIVILTLFIWLIVFGRRKAIRDEKEKRKKDYDKSRKCPNPKCGKEGAGIFKGITVDTLYKHSFQCQYCGWEWSYLSWRNLQN